MAVGTDAELHCWASWIEDHWMFMLLARRNSSPQFVLVSIVLDRIFFKFCAFF